MPFRACTSRVACSEQLSFFSPAKINLFFRVLHKRDDGFHEIASLYQAITLGDVLHVKKAKQDHLACSDPTLAMCENNLVCRALSLFREKTGIVDPVHIHLEKNIPRQAGLGGGSSNAATTLWALYKLFGLSPSIAELEQLGSSLGSDVPFFFSSGTSYCTGRGEKLLEVSLKDSFYETSFWIAKPLLGLSTPEVYSACNPSLFSPQDPLKTLDSFTSSSDPFFYNDLEEAAFFVLPELKNLKKSLLESGFDQVVMSGSGSSFFCLGSISPPVLENVAWVFVKPWKGGFSLPAKIEILEG
jgi:4-diphosphocytidyl-2-C-methyl-D-erythritol kinase